MIARLRRALARIAAVWERIAGAPDYGAYADYMARAPRPAEPRLTQAEFVRERLEARYGRPGTRCC